MVAVHRVVMVAFQALLRLPQFHQETSPHPSIVDGFKEKLTFSALRFLEVFYHCITIFRCVSNWAVLKIASSLLTDFALHVLQ